MGRSRRWLAGCAAAVLAMAIVGCGATADRSEPEPPATPPSSSATSSATSTAPPGPVVTVPALPGATAPSSPAPRPSSSGAVMSSAAASGPRTTTVGPSSASAGGPATSSSGAVPTTSRAVSPSPTTARSTTPTIALTNCPGCAVLAYERAVTGGYGAVLARSPNGRGLLLTVAPDGTTRSGVNIPYGATFKAPFGGVLPCDDDGFCIVIAATPEGKAIASAFRMLPSGSWQDVSGDDGFLSDTADARAVDVDGDGRFEIATQIEGPSGPLWLVSRWSGSAFTTLGCGPGGDPPAAAELSTAACEG